MFCEELLLPSVSPFSTCTLSCYMGGREGTCEAKEVKAGVEKKVVYLPSLYGIIVEVELLPAGVQEGGGREAHRAFQLLPQPFRC